MTLNKGERLAEQIDLIYDEYSQALRLQDWLIVNYPEEGEVIEDLKVRLKFDDHRVAAERVDLNQENPSSVEVDAVFAFGACVTTILEYCKSTKEEMAAFPTTNGK